jgi:hypothetical protein
MVINQSQAAECGEIGREETIDRTRVVTCLPASYSGLAQYDRILPPRLAKLIRLAPNTTFNKEII